MTTPPDDAPTEEVSSTPPTTEASAAPGGEVPVTLAPPSGQSPPPPPASSPPPPPGSPGSVGPANPGGQTTAPPWYGGPPYPPGAYHRYGPSPNPYETPSTPVAVIAGVAFILAVLLAAALGAGIEYASNHNVATTQSPNIIPLPGSSSSSPTTNTPAGIDVASITASVDPALVVIDTTRAEGGAAAGTGMVITSSGLVLTNNHVIEDATTINARVRGKGRTYSATVLGYSVTDDVALLQLHGASGLKTVDTGNSSNLRVGQPVVAIGNALGNGTPAAVAGTITALNQTITAGDPGTQSETLQGLVETDAAIQQGDSGGPMVNASGHVIGMVTATSTGLGLGTQAGTNQGYAIGINHATAVANQIKAGNASATIQIGPRPLLGVEVSDGSQSGSAVFGGPGVAGAYIQNVEVGSPAANAGLATGETITSVNNQTISSASDLSNALLTFKPGDTVTVGWVDTQSTHHDASVRLTTGPPA